MTIRENSSNFIFVYTENSNIETQPDQRNIEYILGELGVHSKSARSLTLNLNHQEQGNIKDIILTKSRQPFNIQSSRDPSSHVICGSSFKVNSNNG